MQKGDEMRMGVPSAKDHLLKNTPADETMTTIITMIVMTKIGKEDDSPPCQTLYFQSQSTMSLPSIQNVLSVMRTTVLVMKIRKRKLPLNSFAGTSSALIV